MTRNLRTIWPTLLLCTLLLSAGGVAGFMLRPIILPVADATVEEDPAHGADAGGHGSSSIVEIKESTMENMSLKTGKFEVRDYYQTIRIPAQVVERIPQGRRRITAPIGGRVSKVYIAQGQAVRPGEKLFELRITDEALSQAQVELLGVMSEIKVNEQQFARIKPLVDSGVVAGKRLLDLEFEINKLTARGDAARQELAIRGMTDQQIDDFVKTKQLVQSIIVFAPDLDSIPPKRSSIATSAPTLQTVSLTSAPPKTDYPDDEKYFTVESISALEGTNLELGEGLCELTHHRDLLIKGLAFESDVDRISFANEKGWLFTAQFGEGVGNLIRENLKLYLIENHVDEDSQTFPIFVEIGNEIISRTTDDQERIYVNWRFKPGQRAHLEVPINVWEKQVVVPLAALVREGPETFVFQKISHTHEGPDGTVHEFSKVPVKVLHTDKHHAVLAKNIKLDVYEAYALDQAYQLNLALKQAAGGGADPHAGHDHPH